MRRLKPQAAFSILALAACASAQAATSGYLETWDNQGDLAGWFASTTSSTVVNPGAGGNPDGYLLVRRDDSFSIGVTTDLADATGSYAGQVWTASVDLRGLAGDVSDAWLRFRFQDSTYNGWRYRLSGPLADAWATQTVSFDANWSDAEAALNGWQNEGVATVGFAQTLGNVYHPEVRFDGTRTLLVGVDNFSITAVPEPGTYALFALGLAAMGVAARRRPRL